MNRITHILVAAILCFCCERSGAKDGDDMKNHQQAETIRFFSGFSGYAHPVKLTGERPEKEARALKAYYIARYDSQGRLVMVKKMLDGKFFFQYDYTYDKGNKLKMVSFPDENGSVTKTITYTEDGRSILRKYNKDGQVVSEDTL